MFLFLPIPYINSLYIDGQVNLGEWSDASVTELPGQVEILFMHDLGHLYVAFRFLEKGIGSLCVQKNNEIQILHASAALGTAVYIRKESIWKLREPFGFSMSETDSSGDIGQKRADYLEKHGWVASTVSMDDSEADMFLEYKIRLDLFDPSRSELGVAGMQMGSNQALFRLPENLNDGCSNRELIRGFPPEQEQFDPSGWLHFTIEDG